MTTPPSGEVTIAGRVFRLGAVYAPRLGARHGRKPRRLLNFDPNSPLPAGRVDVETVPAGTRRVMAEAEWAGEPVEGGGR